ncbi:hypothetical protein Droror1_Dr00019763 [Drosera rotundifolia]
MPPHRRRLSSSTSSLIPSCFHPSSSSSTTTTSAASLTTSLHQTHLGLVILTWSRSFLSRHLRLHLLSSSPSSSFHLSLHPLFPFSSSKGTTPFSDSTLHYDFTRSRFTSSPEPLPGSFSISLGDLSLDDRCLLVRREHVFGTRRYKTRAGFGGREWAVEIECDGCDGEDPRLRIGFDGERVVEVKHLRWKFRGNERVVLDGKQPVQVSWDVYNWLFEEENNDDGYALFTFRFEKTTIGEEESTGRNSNVGVGLREKMMLWGTGGGGDTCGLEFERKKMKRKKMLSKSRSPSSSSLSSASSGCGSVMEWESVEENELKGGPTGFSLLVYAWKK